MEYDEIIKNVKIYGLENAVKCSKYPMATDTEAVTADITVGVNNRGKTPAGTGHNNFLIGVIVQFDLTFTVKAWTEAERYHFFDIISSQSTMHKIAQMEIAKNCIEYVTPETIKNVERLAAEYLADSTAENYLRLLYNVPTGLQLTAGMTTNYLQLKTIYRQRRTHRLPEWRIFCEWLETLPHSEWITQQEAGA